MGLNQQPNKPNALPTRREIWGVGFKLYCTVIYIPTMLHLTVEPRGRPVASSVYHIYFIITENVAVDEIGRIICSHLLAYTQMFFIYNYYACMTQWRVTLWINIALYSINKNFNPTLHISRRSSVWSAFGSKSKGCWFEPTVRNYFSSNNVCLFA